MEDVTFFCKDKSGCIMCLAQTAPLADILTADGATLKLDKKRMDTRVYTCTNKPLATQSTAQFARWDGATNTYAKIKQPEKCSYAPIGWTTRHTMSWLTTSAQP